jgi:2-oxoglutarate ferredoxin oxidoreductase subunit beta
MRTNLNKIQRCPGCWDTLIIWAIKKAFEELKIESHERVVVSGVGCSWKASQYINWYAAETLHGRTLPFATWVKISNENLTVIAVWWDGDGYGIWMWHFIHACKRDLDITYIVFDNENYALTTGQASPTTPIWAKTKTTPLWNENIPLNPIKLAEVAGCKFAKAVNSTDFALMKEIIKEAINHKWFSLVNIYQVCPSFKRW